jgi:hypothetical protein
VEISLRLRERVAEDLIEEVKKYAEVLSKQELTLEEKLRLLFRKLEDYLRRRGAVRYVLVVETRGVDDPDNTDLVLVYKSEFRFQFVKLLGYDFVGLRARLRYVTNRGEVRQIDITPLLKQLEPDFRESIAFPYVGRGELTGSSLEEIAQKLYYLLNELPEEFTDMDYFVGVMIEVPTESLLLDLPRGYYTPACFLSCEPPYKIPPADLLSTLRPLWDRIPEEVKREWTVVALQTAAALNIVTGDEQWVREAADSLYKKLRELTRDKVEQAVSIAERDIKKILSKIAPLDLISRAVEEAEKIAVELGRSGVVESPWRVMFRSLQEAVRRLGYSPSDLLILACVRSAHVMEHQPLHKGLQGLKLRFREPHRGDETAVVFRDFVMEYVLAELEATTPYIGGYVIFLARLGEHVVPAPLFRPLLAYLRELRKHDENLYRKALRLLVNELGKFMQFPTMDAPDRVVYLYNALPLSEFKDDMYRDLIEKRGLVIDVEYVSNPAAIAVGDGRVSVTISPSELGYAFGTPILTRHLAVAVAEDVLAKLGLVERKDVEYMKLSCAHDIFRHLCSLSSVDEAVKLLLEKVPITDTERRLSKILDRIYEWLYRKTQLHKVHIVV